MFLKGGITFAQLNQIIGPCGDPNVVAVASPEAQAMYLSTMAFESVKLTYVRNQTPGRPGQGTYSMMMPNNLFLFVKDNLNLFSGTHLSGLVTGTYSDADIHSKTTILDTLVQPQYAFMPGAWWITKGATLANGCKINMNMSPTPVQAGEFMNSCIGVQPDEVRMAGYNNALAVLKQ
ncbi:hypothetical protein CONCODRAFT_4437 [Conidiobolus coronatus NRRL 28638]|uniref:Uncharacterized protein n=1 Tax=Conidiobolus coronatus (strain ATCC 28846 / CBS 209.66 / NRRL 28638) TaxID=796925 RepID=A0A137PCK8_CONC2|nr:hypothetical protein CONCODRAFT_4437 [Conidiobolus coronatus NRRL 28638]|eukprot:KXN72702.1 hypothetical protein CONCODRAFT_4437 [Conidiobolus coronatus NRRL 28638]